MFMAVATVCLISCSKEDVGRYEYRNDSIILQISSARAQSRAINEDVLKEIEEKVGTLDVFIFDNDNLVTHESFGEAELKNGKVYLKKRRSELTKNKRYWVYLVANSKENLDGIASLSDLRSKTRTDENIHMTGMSVSGIDIPGTFLMDGIAYAGSTEPAVPGSVVLYDGVQGNNTELTVSLRRAAAKIVVKIQGGEGVNFTGVEGNRRGYYMRNMPYETTLLSEVSMSPLLRTPDKSNADRFFYMDETNNTVDIVTYAYSSTWKDQSMTKQTSMLINIPMYVAETTTNPDGTVEFVKDSNGDIVFKSEPLSENWYRVPLSKEQNLKRNHCYLLSFKINAPGANSEFKPVDIDDIEYKVMEWGEARIELGGTGEQPIFLYLNRKELDMHNISEDKTGIRYSSSSEITITLDSAYYYDKFGNKINVPNDIKNSISAKVSDGSTITGTIEIYSPIPTNNTIQYAKFKVTNKEGEVEYFTIKQYPLEYIAHVRGYYSYRSDFIGTTNSGLTGITHYELLNGQKVEIGSESSSPRYGEWRCGCSISGNDWTYSTGTGGFFDSKVANYNADGTATISSYYWSEERKYFIIGNYVVRRNTSSHSNLNNGRMYHIRITSTSDEYIIGRPRITNGVTDPGEDNAQLVSPSFMIASQLGAVTSTNNSVMPAKHCEQYVEVDMDGNVYDDWRLPTAAEVKIIMKYQNSSPAMDKVLTGDQYWCASGVVETSTGAMVSNPGASPIRCIRDSYDTK